MIRIARLDDEPLAEVRYMNAAPGGGKTEISRLPITRAELAGPLAEELDAIVCASDLQGIVAGELLGVALAAELERLCDEGALPPAPRTGIVLAGDLYSVPAANKRGGFGSVATVWEAFAARFAWVAGVAGNHDDVEDVEVGHVLDGDVVRLDGIAIGGVGGVIGNPNKPGRRREEDHLAMIGRVLDREPAILVLHEGPHGDDHQTGHAEMRALVEAHPAPPFVVCGHRHWAVPLAAHDRGQILNVDARAVVLTAPGSRRSGP